MLKWCACIIYIFLQWKGPSQQLPDVSILNFSSYICVQVYFCIYLDINGSVQDCSNSRAYSLELLQSCTKPSICPWWPDPTPHLHYGSVYYEYLGRKTDHNTAEPCCIFVFNHAADRTASHIALDTVTCEYINSISETWESGSRTSATDSICQTLMIHFLPTRGEH